MPITDWMIAPAATGHRRLLRAGALLLALTILLTGVLNTLGTGRPLSGAAGTAGYAVTALLVTARALWIRRSSTAWAMLAGGLAAWTVAYAMYVFDAQPWSGSPAASDLLWLAGYVGFYAAIIALARERIARHAGMWLDGLGGALALASVAVAAIVPAVLDRVEGSTTPAGIALAYPLADALLLTLLVTLAAMAGWNPGRAFLALGAAMVALVVSDLPYFIAVAAGDFEPATIVDTLWLLSAAAMAAAAWLRPPLGSARRSGPGGSLAFPVVTGVAAVAVLVEGALGHAPLAAIVLAMLALAVCTLRMLLSYRELHELAESRRLSRTDDLTGLANRRRLVHSLEGTLARRSEVAVLLLGVDNFKELNDALGNESGDAVLCGVAERLANAVRPGDLAARIGGDEFAVLLRGGEHELALTVARRLAHVLAAPLTVAGVRLRVSSSIGVVMAPEHGADADRLLRRADLAMAHARAHNARVATFADHLEAHALDRVRLAGELARALEEGELVLHYQPVAGAHSGEIDAVEALVRWQHPQRGLLQPAVFLPALERTTLAHEFSRHVLATAVAQTVTFRAAGRPLRVAVNLMASDVLDAGLPAQVERLLAAHGARAEDLVLEVTESGVLSDFDTARDVLEQVRALGVRIALDDFGTGHSSLRHLQRLPVDTLKVDRSFVSAVASEPATAAIVRAMIELAHTLGQRVVAEGIEDAALWRRLAGWGCDHAQGWLVGRAVPADELLETMPVLEDRARLAAGHPALRPVA